MAAKSRAITILSVAAILGILCTHVDAQERRRTRRRGGGRSDQMKIVCSFSDYATIAKELVGDGGDVQYIAKGNQDPHFVAPKPSYAMMLREADLWVTTGMDLEVWSTTLLDKARNKQIMDGAAGFVSASDGVKILQKVQKADRTEGDIHLMGNPHINTSPLNWNTIAENITIGLSKIDPDNADVYADARDAFVGRVDRALFGDALVELFGGEALRNMLANHTLFTFLEKEYQDGKLIDQLGGWLKEALPLRDAKVVAYHKNWAYFVDAFGLDVIGYVELKPGIPPSAKHVQDTIKLIKDNDVKIMLVASYFEKKTPLMIESRTGVKALYLPLSVQGVPEATDNFALIDYWIDQINSALR